MINPFAMLKSFSAGADEVLRGMKPTPGGDAYGYHGSMNAVEMLRDALTAFHDWEMHVALEQEDDVADGAAWIGNDPRAAQARDEAAPECPDCGGAGRLMDSDPFSSVDRECRRCNGSGLLPTHEGHLAEAGRT